MKEEFASESQKNYCSRPVYENNKNVWLLGSEMRGGSILLHSTVFIYLFLNEIILLF